MHKTSPSRFERVKIWADDLGTDQTFPIKAARLLIRFLYITFIEFNGNALSLRAAALTYTVLLSLVPMLAMSTAVVKGLGGSDHLRKAAYSYLDNIEQSGMHLAESMGSLAKLGDAANLDNRQKLTGHLRTAVDEVFAYVDKTNFATLGSLGLAGVLLSVMLVLGFIEEAMNTIWKAARSRSLPRKVADYLTLLILLPLSLNITFAASALLQSQTAISKLSVFLPFTGLQPFLLKFLPVASITFTFFVMYLFFPNTKVRTLPALFGAGLAAIVWTFLQDLYIALQIGVANYNAIYGSFASLPLFLVWIYFGWLFILLGAQAAYSCQCLQSYRLNPLPYKPVVKLGAAFDIMEYIFAAFREARVITSRDVVLSLTLYEPPLVMEILAQLEASDLLHTSQTDKRLLPATPEATDNIRGVVEAIFGTEAPATPGGMKSLQLLNTALGRQTGGPISVQTTNKNSESAQ